MGTTSEARRTLLVAERLVNELARPVWLTAREVAAAWGVSANSVRRWGQRGLVPVMKTPGGALRFDVRALPPTEAP